MGAVTDLIARDLGGPVDLVERSFTVGLQAAFVALRQDPERLAYLIVNVGDQVLFLRFREPFGPAVPDDAVQVSPDGGAFGVTVRDDFIWPTYRVFARSSGLGTTARVIEIRRGGVPPAGGS